jgi:hypothetical protein
MSETARPEVLNLETERELLQQRLAGEVAQILPLALKPELTVGENADAIASMAVTGVLRYLRVMSARQVAVLLAQEANVHVGYVIHEPPRYSAEEIGNVR